MLCLTLASPAPGAPFKPVFGLSGVVGGSHHRIANDKRLPRPYRSQMPFDYPITFYPISLFHFGNPPLDLDLHNPPVNLFIFPVHNSDVTNILRAFALATNPSQTHKIVSRRLRTRFRIGSLTIRRPGRHT